MSSFPNLSKSVDAGRTRIQNSALLKADHPLSDVRLLRSFDGLIGRVPRSILRLTELLDDLRLLNLISLGSAVSKPPALANSIKISVRLTTPTRRPLILAPGSALADTDGPNGATIGVFGLASAT